MEDLQRRKRPVTYGKPARKRLSIIDDIFSPTAPSRPTSTTVDSPAPPKLSGRTAARVADNVKERLQSSVIDRKRSVPQPAVTKPLKVAARASTRAATTEESANGRTQQAAGARAQVEAPTMCKDNLSIFDLPDDGDNDREPVRRFPVKRSKRNPTTAAKPPPKAKAKADKPPVEKLKSVDAVEPVARTKASRTTRSKQEEESVPKNTTRPIKAATTAKVAKLSNGPLHNARKVIQTQTQAQTRLSPSEIPTLPVEASTTRGPQKKSKVDADSARPHLVAAEKTTILAKPNATAQPKVSSGKNIKVPTERKGPPKVTKPKKAKKGSSSKPRASRSKSKSKSKSKSPPKDSKENGSGEPGFWEVFRAGIAASSPPRKRLIDTLGDDTDHPRKKSRSPSGNSVNPEDSPGDSQSQPMFTFDSQQMTLEIERGQELRPVGGAGPRVTYARQRSYRVEESGSLDDLLNMPIPVAKSTVPGRRRLVAPNPAVGAGKEAKRTKTTIRSIHEMRAAGEYSRFVDDVEELFQDIEGIGPISARRSSYMELTNKLRDRSFSQKFRTNGFDERLLVKMDAQTDEVICFVICYLAIYFLHEDSTPRTLLQICNNGILSMLVSLFSSSRDIVVIAKDKKMNMSKAAQSQVSDLRELVGKSVVLSRSATKVLSPQILSLKLLDLIVRRFRAHGSVDEILPSNGLHGLIDILGQIVATKEYPKILKTNGLQLLELPVSTLEASTMGGYASLEGRLSEDEFKVLAKLFPTALGWNCDEDLGAILLLLLRLDINITNNHPATCDALCDTPLISSLVGLIKTKFEELSGILEEQERLLAVDLLVLGLGLMMNFAEHSAAAREVIGRTVISSLEGHPHAVEVLLDIFLDRLERTAEADSMEESHTNVAFGYLAVVLGDLCQNDYIRYTARGRLPNSNLKSLLGAIEEFIAHHRKVDQHMQQELFGSDDSDISEEGQPGPHTEFTQRLQAVMVRLRAYT